MRCVWTWLAVIAFLSMAAEPLFVPRALQAADAAADPVFTNKTRFRIPFRYDAAEMQRLQAREVQLYVSTDHGTRWRMVDKVEPHGDHFDFQAPADGEYWFAVRTLDAVNRLHPRGSNIEPGLKVVVDATPPVLEIGLTEVEPGKVELRWNAVDAHLDVTKLRLEYKQPDSPDWQLVGIVPQPSGLTTWTLPAGGNVAVKGSIGDLAGNTATAEKELVVHPGGRPQQKGNETEYRAPVAGMGEPQDPAAPNNMLPPSPAAPPSNTADKNDADRAPHDDAKETASSGPRIRPKATNSLVSDFPSSRPPIVQKSQPLSDPIPATSEPSAAGDFAPVSSVAPQPQPNANEPRAILVNGCNFEIAYRLDDVGPSGVGKVELFITQDNGHKWYRYGTDPDHQSPFNVSVPADGTYGFEIRVKNGAGVGDDPPRPGEKPSIVVTVDQTPPTVRLMPPQVGRGNSRNKILIQWAANDNHFGSTPILLEYAAQPSGPWQKIDDWQANTGRTVWTLTSGLPGKVFLRLTARDEAGNVTTETASDPLVIDLTRPTARIVDVESHPSESHRD